VDKTHEKAVETKPKNMIFRAKKHDFQSQKEPNNNQPRMDPEKAASWDIQEYLTLPLARMFLRVLKGIFRNISKNS